jgi:hypothetical protein
MIVEQLIAELLDLAEITRHVARTIGDPAISQELEKAADRVVELARIEAIRLDC